MRALEFAMTKTEVMFGELMSRLASPVWKAFQTTRATVPTSLEEAEVS